MTLKKLVFTDPYIPVATTENATKLTTMGFLADGIGDMEKASLEQPINIGLHMIMDLNDMVKVQIRKETDDKYYRVSVYKDNERVYPPQRFLEKEIKQFVSLIFEEEPQTSFEVTNLIDRLII